MKVLLFVLALIVAGIVIYLITKGRSIPGGSSGKGESLHPPIEQPRDVAKLVEPFHRPAILIKKTEEKSTSFFGGVPPKYPGFVWPERDGRPLSFLACIDLAMTGAAFDWLPRTGWLLFFYDLEDQPWGFDPEDRGGWAVVYLQDPSTVQGDASEPEGLRGDRKIRRQTVRLQAASLPPSWEQDELTKLNLSDGEQVALIDLRSSIYGDYPHHQVGGYPDPIQTAEMALECQLVSHGLYCGDPSGYRDPRAEKLKEGVPDWKLLLQMDSDDDLDVMWGDSGMIYFWVRAQDASKGDFSKARLVLQCY